MAENTNSTNSVLISIKKLLGIPEEVSDFDTDIIMHINSVFLTLNEIGVGPSDGFYIEDKDTLWTDYIDEGMVLNSVKSYMYLKVRLLFDPPSNSTTIESINRQISEFEWRIMIAVDQPTNEGEGNQNES